MLVLVLMGHILDKIFKMKYETHAYGIERFLKSEIKEKDIHFEN